MALSVFEKLDLQDRASELLSSIKTASAFDKLDLLDELSDIIDKLTASMSKPTIETGSESDAEEVKRTELERIDYASKRKRYV